MFTSFFSSDTSEEAPENAKTMAQYYADMAAAVLKIRESNKDADLDPGFKQAADVLIKVEEICRDMEEVNPVSANSKNGERSELMRTMGEKGLIDVTGEASKQLATDYIKLLRALNNKEYWPSADCPAIPFVGTSFYTEYAKKFRERVPRTETAIKNLEERIAAYDRSLQPRLAH